MRISTQLSWRPKPLDLVLPGIVLVLGLYEAAFPPLPDVRRGIQALLTACWSVSLVVRRRWPIPVLAFVVVLGPTYNAATDNEGVTSYVLAVLTASYAVGREVDPPRAWWGPVLNVAFYCAYAAVTGQFRLTDYFFASVLYGGTWAAGLAIRRREKRVEELAHEAEDLKSHHEERDRELVSEERARMARELHDIVAHSLSAITLQTQAVRLRLGPHNSSEAEDLRGIEMTSRQAMSEMRHLLGVLKSTAHDHADLAPQPGLDQLPRLLKECHGLGQSVTLAVSGTPYPLSPGIDLVAYRLVQESLTNARKHTHTGAANLDISYTEQSIELTVVNDVDAKERAEHPDGGHGLIGMRERVRLYNGGLKAGPDDSGHFVVQARLPVKPVEP